MNIKVTPLHSRHIELGALMSPFAGFDMPIQYTSIIDEHQAVRNECGVFDVSHMGEIFVSGQDAERFVNHIFSNDVTGMLCGKILYGMLLHDNGCVVDDLLVYRLEPEKFLLVVNASNIEKDFDHIIARSKDDDFNVIIANLSDDYAQIAVQGPKSEDILHNVLAIDTEELSFYTFSQIFTEDGDNIIVSRTGYTGEDGFEIYGTHARITAFWDELIKAGIKPCGLGCRDTLRFEVGLPLYGNELSDSITPLESGLGIFVKLDKDEFVGKNALVAQKAAGVSRKLVGIELHDKAIPRHGYPVVDSDENEIGVITTGYRGISTERSVAMALVDINYAKLDTEVAVKIRRKTVPAHVVRRQFYKKSYKQ